VGQCSILLIRKSVLITCACFLESGSSIAQILYFARLLSYDEGKPGAEEGKQYTYLEWWRAYYHFVRPHEALRVAPIQPRERGGNRLAQRYRPRTPAMAAGRTTRRWTAREVLACPLSPVSA
jgi:hypothetical protein